MKTIHKDVLVQLSDFPEQATRAEHTPHTCTILSVAVTWIKSAIKMDKTLIYRQMETIYLSIDIFMRNKWVNPENDNTISMECMRMQNLHYKLTHVQAGTAIQTSAQLATYSEWQ